jgi:hypothetical protein
MTAQSTRADLPPQLRALSARAQDLTDTVRDALQATLSISEHNATPSKCWPTRSLGLATSPRRRSARHGRCWLSLPAVRYGSRSTGSPIAAVVAPPHSAASDPKNTVTTRLAPVT